MKLTRRLCFLMMIGILASCTACGSETPPVPVEESTQEETDNIVSSSKETPVLESEENSDTQELKLDHTYVTQFGTVNAVSYPCFLFDYPENWTITKEEVSQTDETVVLTNERGSTITYTYIGGVAEGQLGSGSATDMTRIELSAVADSQFIPGYVDARNYEDLGKFVVAETKITGTMDMLTDSDFVDTDGAVSFAVLPENRTFFRGNEPGVPSLVTAILESPLLVNHYTRGFRCSYLFPVVIDSLGNGTFGGPFEYSFEFCRSGRSYLRVYGPLCG